jgi:hypothetical protein
MENNNTSENVVPPCVLLSENDKYLLNDATSYLMRCIRLSENFERWYNYVHDPYVIINEVGDYSDAVMYPSNEYLEELRNDGYMLREECNYVNGRLMKN